MIHWDWLLILHMELLVVLAGVAQVNLQLGNRRLGLVQLALPFREFSLELLLDGGDGLFTVIIRLTGGVTRTDVTQLKALLGHAVDGIGCPLKFPHFLHVGHQPGVELLQGLLVVHLGLREVHHALTGPGK